MPTVEDRVDPAGDVRRLWELKQEQDGRTITEMIEDDEYKDVEIEKVEESTYDDEEDPKPGRIVFVQWDGGTGTGIRLPEGKEVKVGDTVRFYGGAHLGGSHHGVAVNGELLYWKTPWERFAERIDWLAGYDRRKREQFDKHRESLDKRYEELPPPLKARIARFRAEDPSFRVESEAYEMAAVGDAPKIAKAVAEKRGWKLDEKLRAHEEHLDGEAPVGDERVEEAIKEFFDLGYEEQKKMVPDLDEGHSGNTFGGAVRLAFCVLAGKDC